MPHNRDINSDIIPHAIIQSSMTSQFSRVMQDAHKSRRRPASLNCTWINPPSGGHANLAQQKPPRIPEAVRVRLRDHLHNTAAARIRSRSKFISFRARGTGRVVKLSREPPRKRAAGEKGGRTSSCREKFRNISSIGKRRKLETAGNWLCYRWTAVTNEW